MKILLLADPSNPHTIKWANSLYKSGLQVYVFGLFRFDPGQYNKNIRVEFLNVPLYIKRGAAGGFLKIFYLIAYFALKRIVRNYNPDIIHAHYATSYGILGALLNRHPFFLNIWGKGDIYDFPQKSFFHKKLYKFILKKADIIVSTSSLMTKELNYYTTKPVIQIPFGVDTNIFIPGGKNLNGTIRIGIVKSLEVHYGIDSLLRAFALVKNQLPEMKLELKIAGDGSLRAKLEKLARELHIDKNTEFSGWIPYNRVFEYHQKLDISVYPSVFETFGVAVLESSACGIPVIVTDSGGLPEVVENNKTGFIVPSGDIAAIADAIIKLVLDKELRVQLGQNGRQMVVNKFNWTHNVETMIRFYRGEKYADQKT